MSSPYISSQTAVLGSMLISPEVIGGVVAEVRPADFGNGQFRIIFQAMLDLHLAGDPVDPVTVINRLGGSQDFMRILVELMDATPTAANVFHYVKLIKQQAALAALQSIGLELANCSGLDDAASLIDRANAAFSTRPGTERLSANDLLKDFWARHGEGRRPEYYSWGLAKLNAGIAAERGDMIVIGGYPSAGKTAFALGVAWHMATKHRVGFYSLETRPQKLGDRSVSHLGSIDFGAIKKSSLSPEEWARIGDRANEISQRTIDMISAGGMSVQDIRADALAHRYEIVFVDYLQLIHVEKAGNRTEAVSSISIGLHQMAQGNNITVVALSQLRRPDTSKSGEESAPTMSSLRESGQIEQDADAIMLLYKEDPKAQACDRILKIVKNKEGETGKFPLAFDGATQTFSQRESPGAAYSEIEKIAYRAKRKLAEAAQQSMLQQELPLLPQDTPVPFEETGG